MEKSEIDRAFGTILIIWASLVAGVSMFAGAVWLLTDGPLGGNGPSGVATIDGNTLVLVLVAALGILLAGIAFRRLATVRKADSSGATVTAYQTHIIVSSAIIEGGGLMGVAMCYLAGRGTWALGIGALAVFAMVLTRPSRAEMDRLLR